MPRPPAILDGHNDTLTRIHDSRGDEARSFLVRSGRGHLDLPRAREGGLAGGFCAIFTPSPDFERKLHDLVDDSGAVVQGGWSAPLPRRLPRRTALAYTLRVMSSLFRMVESSRGAVAVVRSVAELERCAEEGTFAVILHVEGAEVVDAGLRTLDVLYQAGLRSLGPVWSRPNLFGHGVPFDFPRGPDTGPGLTAAGKRLIARCNELGVLVDLSHLNEKGFWDVVGLSEAPLVATHSNAFALCPSPRNLTDDQLDAVAASGGVVGLNFHVGFLREDGRWEHPTSLTEVVRHARYIADRLGVEHLALGSDFDGATMPADLPDAAALPRLLDALADAGFTPSDVRAIAWDNWIRVLKATWRA